MLVALALNAGYTAAEVVAGLATNSLALLADAGHNLSDVVALAIALFAASLAGRPPTAKRSFGYMRAEILSALVNAASLVVIAGLIAVEAVRRIASPPELTSRWMIVVATLGVAVNAVSALMLLRAGRTNLNIRAAVVHLGGDTLSSVGVVVAGLVIAATGWVVADPIAGLLIAGIILLSARGILRDSVGILLEGTPRGIDAAEVGGRMASVGGVREVHDLHIWEITSGFPALAAHVLVEPGADCHAKRRELEHVLAHDFGIEHTTLQVDHIRPELVQIRRGR